eukprot:TRINITY_DN74273_c0_g1_i1.p2 TRINITY_DN74273_c0_g1~~TRINITY_DN74273_c0_g1_i1.p2  ORF type:complete len:229 (+),score=30.77 TRINITY_DN74273_c0_g1_i1:303-989(+)
MQFTSAFQNPPRKRRQGGKQNPIKFTANPGSSSMQTAAPVAALETINHRLEDLEEVVYRQHDPQLRALDFWATSGWLLDQGDPLVPLLGAKLQDWNASRPLEGPHPWGPPRRCLTHELCAFLDSRIPSDGPFAQYHKTLLDPSDLETLSVSYLLFRKTQDGHYIFKLRPAILAWAPWQEAIKIISKHVLEHKGVVLPSAAPPNKIVKKHMNKKVGNKQAGSSLALAIP